jgi:hypothetical protein
MSSDHFIMHFTHISNLDPLVYLVSSAEAVAASGALFVFSDGNCASTVTSFDDDLSQIESVVDWEVMRAQMWVRRPLGQRADAQPDQPYLRCRRRGYRMA